MQTESEGLAGECEHGRVRVRLPRELRWLWGGCAATVVLAVVVGWLKWRAGLMVYNWDPLSEGLFVDMMEYPGTYTLLHTRAFFFNFADKPWPYPMFSPVAYPPFAAAMMAPLYAFPIPELLFLVVAGLWIGVLVWWVARALMRAGVAWWTAVLLPLTMALMSFPIARLVHQGNIELVLWVFTAVGVWAWMGGHDDAAAVLWGLAAAMKLFPLVLLSLLLPRKKWRAVTEGVATFVAATVWSLWWLGPSVRVAWAGTMRNVFGYQGVRMAEWTLRELVANHSTIELAKMAATMVHYPMGKLTLPYYAAGALVFAAAFFGKLWKMPEANQLLGVSTFMVAFPPISYYHALVHLYAPLIVLGAVALRAQRAGVRVKGLMGTMLLFVPLFASFTVLTYPQVFVYCGLVQAVVLVVLFFRALEYRLEVVDATVEVGAQA